MKYDGKLLARARDELDRIRERNREERERRTTAAYAARPELRGKPLPDAVLRTALEENQPLLRAYLDHEQRETSAELARLREENRVYRQNAEAAKRSPVQGAANPGGDDPEADPFLTGFNGSGW